MVRLKLQNAAVILKVLYSVEDSFPFGCPHVKRFSWSKNNK